MKRERKPLTGMELAAILGVVALLVLCCVGVSALSVLFPAP